MHWCSKLEIKCLFNGYMQMLDMADSVGDIFVDRTPGGVDERGFTVLVQREPPSSAELSGSVRFASVPPNSFARPPKRPSHGLLQRATAGHYAQENAHERTEQMNKRRRLNEGARHGLLNPDCAVSSTERDLDLPTIHETGVESSRRDASTCIIEDSQRSPLRSRTFYLEPTFDYIANAPLELNTYATLTSLSIYSPESAHLRQTNDLEIPNSPNSRAGSPISGVHEAAYATGEETPKSESPETDNIVNDIPRSNPTTPHAPAPPQSEAQQNTSAKSSLPFPKTETPNEYKRNSVLSATGLTTPRDTTPGAQSVASNTESRPTKPSYGRVSTDRASSSKAFVSGRRTTDIYAVESDIESSREVPLGRTGKRSKQHHSPAVQSLSGPKLFSRFNSSSANRPISSHLSRNFSDDRSRSTSGQAISHEPGLDHAVSESLNIASITAPIFEKSILQRVVDHAGNKIGRELPLFPDSHILDVERLDGESNPKKHREDSAIVDKDQKKRAKKPGKDKPPKPNNDFNEKRIPCHATSSISVSQAVQRQSHVQPLHEESSDTTDMDAASDNKKDTSTDAEPIDSRANTSIPPIYRMKAAKKSAPAESSESEGSETHDSESDEVSDQGQIHNSKDNESAGRMSIASMQGVDSELKTAEKKSLPEKQKPDAPKTSTARSSTAVKGGPVRALSKAPTNKLSLQKSRISITSPIPRQGSALINRSDSLSSRGTPSRNVSSNALKEPSTTSPFLPSLQPHSHRSVSFENEARNVSGKPRPPLVPLVKKESTPVVLSAQELAAKKRQEKPEAKKRQEEEKAQKQKKFREETRAAFARSKPVLALTAQKKPEDNSGKITGSTREPPVPPLPTVVEQRSKDEGKATISEKATASATNAARLSRSPPKTEQASVEAAVVPPFPGYFTTETSPKRVELLQDDKNEGLLGDNKDTSHAFKRPESKSKSRSPARVVSSSISTSSASEPSSESDTDSQLLNDSTDSERNDTLSIPMKHGTEGKSVESAIEGASDRASSDSEKEHDNGKLTVKVPVSLSKSVPTSPALSNERTNSESASARDSAERQVQREIRESMEPSRSSQMGPHPRTSAKGETFSPFARTGPATLEKRGGFSVNARHPTLSSQMNNPSYKNPVIGASRQLKPAAKWKGNKDIDIEPANDTDSTESEDEDDEETGDDEAIGTKRANPRLSQNSEGQAVARHLRKLYRSTSINVTILSVLLTRGSEAVI